MVALRVDNLALDMDHRRWELARTQLGRPAVSPLPARELYRRNLAGYDVGGRELAGVFALLAHYTTWQAVDVMVATGYIGAGTECWLTPTAYAACLAPYNLGLRTPREVCLLVDVSGMGRLWGPGTCMASDSYSSVWRGGAIEFYSADGVPSSLVRRVIDLAPCGDTHR